VRFVAFREQDDGQTQKLLRARESEKARAAKKIKSEIENRESQRVLRGRKIKLLCAEGFI